MTQNQDIQCERPLSDEEIIELYWNRNEKAIQATDGKYGKYLLTIAYHILHDRLDCEECLNDTYLGTWQQIPPTRPHMFQAFLSRIMRNVALDKLRESTAQSRVPSSMMVSLDELGEYVTSSPSVEEEYAVRELCRLISTYLRVLPPRREFMFVCRYYSQTLSQTSRICWASANARYSESWLPPDRG